jgi:tetratricopeptide (TPR) repeat protein
MALLDILERLSKMVSLILLVVTIIGVLIGLIKFRISLLQPLEKIAHDQSEYRRKNLQELKKSELVAWHIGLGLDFFNIGKLPAAKEEFKAALALDPLNTSAELGLFKASILDKTPDGQLDYEITNKKIDFIRHLSTNVNDAHAYYLRGMLNKEINPKEAIRLFRLATKYNDKFADAYYRIGMIYEIHEEFETYDALTFYQYAYDQSPYNQTYLNNLAYQQLQQGDYVPAIANYKEVLKLDKNDLLIYITLSHSLLYNGNLKESAEKMNDMIRIFEKNTEILNTALNGMEWYFQGFGTEKILLNTKEKKMCWAYLNSFYKNAISGNSFKSNRDLEKAEDLYKAEPVDLHVVIQLMEADIGKFNVNVNAESSLLENAQNLFIQKFNELVES